MSMYNLIEDGNNYIKTSGSLLQYCRDEWISNLVSKLYLLKSR